MVQHGRDSRHGLDVPGRFLSVVCLYYGLHLVQERCILLDGKRWRFSMGSNGAPTYCCVRSRTKSSGVPSVMLCFSIKIKRNFNLCWASDECTNTLVDLLQVPRLLIQLPLGRFEKARTFSNPEISFSFFSLRLNLQTHPEERNLYCASPSSKENFRGNPLTTECS